MRRLGPDAETVSVRVARTHTPPSLLDATRAPLSVFLTQTQIRPITLFVLSLDLCRAHRLSHAGTLAKTADERRHSSARGGDYRAYGLGLHNACLPHLLSDLYACGHRSCPRTLFRGHPAGRRHLCCGN